MTQTIRHEVSFYRHRVFVASLMGRFARYLGFSPKDVSHLQIAAVLHDIGKLSVPPRVLTKIGPLEEDERLFIFAHPDEGHRVLQNIGISDSLILSIAREHHERLDGSGYPRGLTASSISEEVRMITQCDVFAALTEVRSYGVQMGTNDALRRMAMKRKRLDLIMLKQFAAMIRTSPVHPFAIMRPRNEVSNQFGVRAAERGAGEVPIRL